MINIYHLNKKFGQLKAIDDLNLEISSGKIFGLLGNNGAGKTTLLSILNGLTTADSGNISIFDLELNSNLQHIRERSSLIPQTLAFYENLTVIENIQFFSSILSLSNSVKQENIENAIEIGLLDDILSQTAATLSGGQKRRLNLAIGLLNSPDIIYFDEPTVGVDAPSRSMILESILELKRQGKTIVYTSHYMHEIEKICDHVAIMERGRIIKSSPLDELLLMENDSLIIETIENSSLITLTSPFIQFINSSSIKVIGQANLASAIKLLEINNIQIKQVNFIQNNLEKLFLDVTQG